MIWNKTQWNLIKILLKKFEVERWYDIIESGYPADILEYLEDKLEVTLSRGGEEQFYEIDSEISHVVKNLTYSELSAIRYGIDYNLELRAEKQIITEDNYPVLFRCFVTLPKLKDEGLDHENHGSGYHIHYVILQNKRPKRTNVLFTFDPSEAPFPGNKLYWEYHGTGINRDPNRFGKRRRIAIYDSSCGFLSTLAKTEFRPPSNSGNVFWPS